MFYSKNKKQKGFTLIELLIVITIIGILSGLAVVGMAAATDQARLAKAKDFASAIDKNLVSNNIAKYDKVEKIFSDTWLRDDSPLKKDGRLWNGTATSSDNPYGGGRMSLSFDGVDDYVWVPEYTTPVGALKPTDELTVSAFFKITDYTLSTGWSSVVSAKEYTGSESGYMLGVTDSGHIYGRISINGYAPGNLQVTGSGAVSNGKWHHAALTYSRYDRKAILYLDGKKDGEASLDVSYSGSGAIIYDDPSNEIKIGDDNISGKIFKGLISNVRIYSGKFEAP